MPPRRARTFSFKKIEEGWRKRWEREGIFQADRKEGGEKYFVTFPFAYMNGPLHLGQGFTGSRLDVIARYKRARGYNVLFPWAWHWTGEAVMGTSDRIKKGDQELRRVLREVDHVPDKEIDKFVNPEMLVRYYTEQNREAVKLMGFSVDWRREFHTSSLHPAYTKYVEWQIRRLADRGYIAKGSHPVVWCPACESPTGDHDRLEGQGVRPEEYVLVKFGLDGAWLVAGTFRPETVFGATNVWVNPEVEYARVQVDEEQWIVASEAVEKLTHQFDHIRVGARFKGKELIGRSAVGPLAERELPILPATFVDPSLVSGVVYSVPSHAPVDWLALRDLRNDRALQREFGLSSTDIESLEPLSIIDLPGYGEHPAIAVCERLGVVDQNDPKAEEATEIVYSREFHTGIMKANCLEFSGLPVTEAKERVREELLSKNLAATLYDLPGRAICKSSDRCIVKVIEDQWFLRYSDEQWKVDAKDAISAMTFYPPELRELFLHYVDWYRDWACTRRTGLGTPFPYDKNWIVETLTDSTVYMAFYIIARHYNEGKIPTENLGDEFFDYVTKGVGDAQEISRSSGVSSDTLEEIKHDFIYWYPVDLRGSAKDLLGNHLTFYIFHHTALFPRELWPRGITVNGYLQLEGNLMSKSKGWFIPMRDAIETYGADATRLTLLLGGEDLDDPDWRRRNAEAVSARVKALYGMVQRGIADSEAAAVGAFERILLSKLQRRIESITKNLDVMKTASAARIVFYDMYNDLREYLNLTERGERDTLARYVNNWARLLQPFAPFLAEEIWRSVCSRESLISSEEWPRMKLDLVSPRDEAVEIYLNKVVDDAKEILKALPHVPNSMTLYVAAPWKWRVTQLVLAGVSEGAEMGSVMSRALKEVSEVEPKEISRLVQELYGVPKPELEILQESLSFIRDAAEERKLMETLGQAFVQGRTGIPVLVSAEDPHGSDPAKKAHRSMPLRPGIFFE